MISVVVPALDEAKSLPQCLRQARAALGGDTELIVVDGGSTDGTAAIAAGAGARIIVSPRGRGRQMNAGAAAAAGDILLFLHADTRLPAEAGRLIEGHAAAPGILGGNFLLRFDAPGSLPRLFAATYNARSRRQRIFYGDSALWVRREVFDALGGFREATLMEDYAFCRALRTEARRRSPNWPLTQTLPLLDATVVTSARRFHGKRGLALRMVATWTLLHLLYACGASPDSLEKRFYPPTGT